MFEFNLLSDSQTPPPSPVPTRNRSRIRVSPSRIFVAAVSAAVFAWILIHHIRADRVMAGWEARRVAAEQAARASSSNLEAQEALEAARDALVTRLDRLQTLDEDRIVWAELWLDLATALPDAVWMVRMEQRVPGPGIRLRLQGSSLDHEGVTNFVTELDQVPRLTRHRLIRVEGTPAMGPSFSGSGTIYHFEIELEG
jgi:Tfp pilus assembly protein PilN